jgi:hypothetical protein
MEPVENEIPLFKTLEEFSRVLEKESIDNSQIETYLQKLNSELNKIKEDKLTKNGILRSFFDRVGSWIVKNFSSVKLNAILIFVSSLLNNLGYTTNIEKEEITKLLQLETYEQILANVNKDKKNYEEFLETDSILTNSFISAFYALIVTISNKPDIVIKSKNLVRSVLTIMTQICEIDNVAIYYKKKRIISNFIKILKELKNNVETVDSLISTTKLLMNIFAKMGNKRPIYRDYMFKKAIPDKITDVFISYYKKDTEIVKCFCSYLFFAIRTVDHKTYFWTKGVVNILSEILHKLLEKEHEDENLIECITLNLYNLSYNNFDIQMELKDQNILEMAKLILMRYSKNYFIIFNTLSCLRRIKDDEYMDIITEELLYTYFALFDYFYLTIKKELEAQTRENFNRANKFEYIILKELVAILGNIVKDEIHSKPFIDKNLHLVLIDLKLCFHSFPKIIKNTIGALINLTNSDQVRENICKVAAFIQSIYIILDKYKENQAIVDYELKLLMNVVKNEITIKMLISGDIFFYLLLFLKNYVSHEEIVYNSIKILRTLILKSKFFKNAINYNI